MSLKQYSNSYTNFTVTKTITEFTKWDFKKKKHVKLAKPKTTEEVVFASTNLFDIADFVRACDMVSDKEGGWHTCDKDSRPKRVLKVEFELEVDHF